MNFKEAQQAYDNMSPPEAADIDYDNVIVLERMRLEHDCDFNPSDSNESFPLMMRVASGEQPDDAIINMMVACMRADYAASFNRFIENEYEEFYFEWEGEQNGI